MTDREQLLQHEKRRRCAPVAPCPLTSCERGTSARMHVVGVPTDDVLVQRLSVNGFGLVEFARLKPAIRSVVTGLHLQGAVTGWRAD